MVLSNQRLWNWYKKCICCYSAKHTAL